MLKGLQNIKAHSEEVQKAKAEKDNLIRTLRISSGDSVKLRFLTDGDEIIQVPFHNYTINFPSGKKFSKDVYCVGRGCVVCDEDKFTEENKAIRQKILAYVFVYEIEHRQKRPDTDWKLDPATKKYLEKVNSPMLLFTGKGNGGYIEGLFTSYYGKYKTLVDRDYTWERKGDSMNDTTYALMPDDKTKASSIVTESKKGLKSLEDLLTIMYSSDGIRGNTKSGESSQQMLESLTKSDESLF